MCRIIVIARQRSSGAANDKYNEGAQSLDDESPERFRAGSCAIAAMQLLPGHCRSALSLPVLALLPLSLSARRGA